MSDGSNYTPLRKPGLTDHLKGYAEGTVTGKSHIKPQEQIPTFVRMIVMEVISDPNAEPDFVKQSSWSGMGVQNMKYADVLPRNTIIAKKVNSEEQPMFVFPFFPSHLSLPCKAGEMVWVMFEKPGASRSDIAYWFCRITEPHYVDDVNHSHPGRSFEASMFPKSEERFQNEQNGTAESGESVWHELRNGPVVRTGTERKTATSNLILKGKPPDIFETLIKDTDAAKLTVFESVPRYRKRPGDVVLEGSNNSLIVLGTDRVGPIAEYTDAKTDSEDLTDILDAISHTKIPKMPLTDYLSSAGMIDMVVGRGQTEKTSGRSTDTTSINDATPEAKGTPLKKELDKSPDAILNSKNEGDPDLRNDRSRILISQRTDVDTNLNLVDYNEEFSITDGSGGDAAIVIKSDKVRLIARSDVEILVTNYTTSNTPDAQDFKDESDSFSKWASIVIKTTGDIIMKPSDEGYIKMGDETADRALLCTDLPAVYAGGKVSATTPALKNTMGGQFGGTGIPSQGTWAKKILVTGANAPDNPRPTRNVT